MTMSCVGASPFIITMIFIAESIIYGVVGASMGYLIGVGITRVASQYLPYVNYSSAAAVMVMGLTILSTFLPSIYPAFKSGKIVTPSLERKWKIPTKATGIEWHIPLPFVATNKDVEEKLSFLYAYFNSHRMERAPLFHTSDILCQKRIEKGKIIYELIATVSLAPYESAVKQKVHLCAFEEENGRFVFKLYLQRLSGDKSTWEVLNRPFIDGLRKQFSLFSALKPADRLKYKKLRWRKTSE